MNDEYTTKDLGEASALLTLGCDLIGIFWKDQTAFFSFRDNAQCGDLSRQYYFSEVKVCARIYYDNLRMLKRKLFGENPRPTKKR